MIEDKACNRCVTYWELGDLSKRKAQAQGIIYRGDEHSPEDCIRHLAVAISTLQERLERKS